ncbi:serine hydrolase domain-containing protein [Streptomyces harbinensis]|uniref:serine hydrolase domain-containing protein n=1 Tax=Streptomyces harbinensis TaxID=1176198 RepID=UPI003712DD1E
MNRRVSTLIALAILPAALVACDEEETVPDAPPAGEAALQREADALLDLGAPGVLATVVTPDEESTVRSGYGDVAEETPMPWDAAFRAGSFTKPFVATVLLQLAGEGALDLEDSVADWLPGLVEGEGIDGSAITVRQLLQHTSGLPEYLLGLPEMFTEEGFGPAQDAEYTPEELIALAVAQPPAFAPGEGWQYSNTNYVLAGMIIEQVTGNGWHQEVRERIVEPLGLSGTSVPTGGEKGLPEPHARGYARFVVDMTDETPVFGDPLDVTELNPDVPGAAGAIVTTTEDATTFLRALLGGELLGEAELALMKETVPAPELEASWPAAEYGLGLMRLPLECGDVWAHQGDIQGFMTRDGVTEDGTRSVAVSVNTNVLLPEGDTPVPEGDATRALIENALCS